MAAKALKRAKNKLHKLLQLEPGENLDDEAIVTLAQETPKLCNTRHKLRHAFSPRGIQGRWHVLHHLVLRDASLSSVEAIYELYPKAIQEFSLANSDSYGAFVGLPLHFCMLGTKMKPQTTISRDVVKFLIDKYPEALAIESQTGGRLELRTLGDGLPIHLAAFHHAEHTIIGDLIEANPETLKVTDAAGMKLLHRLCRHYRKEYDPLIRRAIELYPESVQTPSPPARMLPFAHLCDANNNPASQDILEFVYGAYPDAVSKTDAKEYLPLHHASKNVSKDNDACILFVLGKYSDAAKVPLRTWHSSYPLHMVCVSSSTAQTSTMLALLRTYPEVANIATSRNELPLELYLDRTREQIDLSVANVLMKATSRHNVSEELQLKYAEHMKTEDASEPAKKKHKS